jgi:hypothetical protein
MAAHLPNLRPLLPSWALVSLTVSSWTTDTLGVVDVAVLDGEGRRFNSYPDQYQYFLHHFFFLTKIGIFGFHKR